MTFISSSSPFTSSDHALSHPTLFTFESWMKILMQDSLSLQDQGLFLQGLQDHPEWLNQTNERQKTPLIIATDYEHVEVVQALIQAGADFNLKDRDGWTPLISASYHGEVDLVQTLIQAGANLNLQDQAGWTALMWTSHRGQNETVQLLIQAGADLNVQNKDGWTVLMIASHRGHVDVVQSLLHRGADLEVDNDDLQNAWDLAKKEGHDDVTALLEAYAAQQTLDKVLHLDSSETSSKDTLPPPSSKMSRL